MATLIQKVAQAAMKTFSKDVKDTDGKFRENLASLTALLNRVTARDVCFDQRLVANEEKVTVSTPGFGVAPVTYVHMWEDDVFSMGIFVLRKGARLPLHDHPGMFGFCKVIHGTLKVRSYSKIEAEGVRTRSRTSNPLSRLWKKREKTEIQTDGYESVMGGRRPVNLSVDCEVSDEGEALLLTPTSGNFHEISADSGPAAFVDVLAPPYDERRGARHCHYYELIEELSADDKLLWLQLVPQPLDYWCDSAYYQGPEINACFQES